VFESVTHEAKRDKPLRKKKGESMEFIFVFFNIIWSSIAGFLYDV